MNVSSSTSISMLQSTASVGSTGSAGAPDEPTSPSGVGAAATTSISGPGRLFQQLKQLHDSDPAKFQQVVSSMADSLRADAKNAQGDAATRLSAIADRLDKVAQSGNLSDMAPSQHTDGPHGHHGHHGHHGGGGGSAMSDLESAFNTALSSSTGATAPAGTAPTTGTTGQTAAP